MILDQWVSRNGLEVDKVNISAIESITQLVNIKGVRSFLGHADF